MDKEPHSHSPRFDWAKEEARRSPMNAIIYLVGLVVVVMFVLSLIGLR
ncbi:MAG TPA: hypothetical protein VI232_14785 [Reyranella sp.]|jgi:hypothetical protein